MNFGRPVSIRWWTLAAMLACFSSATLAENRSPVILLTLRGENSLVIIDGASEKVMGRVETGEDPHNAVLSDDGKLVFITNRNGGSISVVDWAARKELHRVQIGPGSRPHGIVFEGGKVYFTAEAYRLMGCYDPATNRVDWLLGLGENIKDGSLLSSDHANMFFAENSASNTVSILKRSGNPPAWDLNNIAVGKGPEGIDLSPDGKELWVAQMGDGAVSVIDVASQKVVATVPVQPKGKESNRLKFTPDGKRVLITDRTGDLVVLDAVSRKETKRLRLGNHTTGITVTPDGSRAYIPLGEDNSIAVVDLKTLEVKSRISTGVHPEGLVWFEPRSSQRR